VTTFTPCVGHESEYSWFTKHRQMRIKQQWTPLYFATEYGCAAAGILRIISALTSITTPKYYYQEAKSWQLHDLSPAGSICLHDWQSSKFPIILDCRKAPRVLRTSSHAENYGNASQRDFSHGYVMVLWSRLRQLLTWPTAQQQYWLTLWQSFGYFGHFWALNWLVIAQVPVIDALVLSNLCEYRHKS